MWGTQKVVDSVFAGTKSVDSSSSVEALSNGGEGAISTHLLLTRPTSRPVTLRCCSKLCAICFVAGVIVGYTLKRRVKRWAAKMLRILKDD